MKTYFSKTNTYQVTAVLLKTDYWLKLHIINNKTKIWTLVGQSAQLELLKHAIPPPPQGCIAIWSSGALSHWCIKIATHCRPCVCTWSIRPSTCMHRQMASTACPLNLPCKMKQKESSPENTGGCFYRKTYWVMEQGCLKKEKRRRRRRRRKFLHLTPNSLIHDSSTQNIPAPQTPKP